MPDIVVTVRNDTAGDISLITCGSAVVPAYGGLLAVVPALVTKEKFHSIFGAEISGLVYTEKLSILLDGVLATSGQIDTYLDSVEASKIDARVEPRRPTEDLSDQVGGGAVFTTTDPFVSETLVVYKNGLPCIEGTGNDYTETSPAAGTFTFEAAAIPSGDDNVRVTYTIPS